MTQQQGDILLFQTDDGGDIAVEDGLVRMSGGLETAAYLSLFGGNEGDDGRERSPANWWGNLGQPAERQYRSGTQHLLQSIPATSGNLRRIEDAASRDLAWFTEQKVASSVTVSASIPGVNRVQVSIVIEAVGVESDFTFVNNWKSSK